MERTAVSAEHTGENSPIAGCIHCGKPVADGDNFCCSGCEAAYEISQGPIERQDFTPFVETLESGVHSLTLSVSGIHCAACLQLIENSLVSEPEVTNARVNMTSERVTFSWNGEASRGTALAENVTALGYGLRPLSDAAMAISEQHEKFLIKCIAVAGFAAGNMMLLSVVLWSDGDVGTSGAMGAATRDLFHWLSALIAVPTVLYSGRPFFKSALSVLKQGHTNMDVPISLAVILATLMSLYEAANSGAHVYFDSAVVLLFFLLTGRYLDARAKGKARASAAGLLSKLAGTAHVVEGEDTRDVPLSQLKAGMEAKVYMGENIPADGEVVTGTSEVDNSLITGETMPEVVTAGSRVYAGTTNLMSTLTMRVTKASEKSLLSEIVRLMETAEQGNARFVRIADRVARLYTPVVHALAAIAFLGWFFLMGETWQFALLNAVTVLIITCPCALGLAVPVVQMLSSSVLMKAGVLLKSGDALEKLAEVDTIVFDKTGTLTVGHLVLQKNPKAHAWNDQDLIIAASMALHSRHPLSTALVRAYKGETINTVVQEMPGKGLEATIDGITYRLGRGSWVCEGVAALSDGTGPEFWLAARDRDPVRFSFLDAPRSDAAETIEKLLALGLELHILSGDREETVGATANDLGFSHYKAAATPPEKATYIDALQALGKKVCVVGDGINDAPALMAADVSMSPSSAVDITQNTADIVFQGVMLSPVIFSIRVARLAKKLVRQNITMALVYNCFAIPAALLGFVTPLVAAIAMSASSLVVIINAFRMTALKRG